LLSDLQAAAAARIRLPAFVYLGAEILEVSEDEGFLRKLE
jgi:hypothetical protein